MQIARRTVLAGAMLPLAAPASSLAGASAGDGIGQVSSDLDRYIAYGVKAAGGPGDHAVGEWLAGELAALQFKVDRQTFQAPWFDPSRADLSVAGAVAPVLPLPIVVPTGPAGVSGRLVRAADAGGAALKGSIAVVELPFSRWSSAMGKAVREPVAACFARGARAVILITHGPTGEAIALNADGRGPMFDRPVAIVAPKAAKPILAALAEQAEAVLTIEGRGGMRPTFNLVGTLDREHAQWLVVSTPRSGWFTCAGERGPGIAIWLKLARWAAARLSGYNVAFLCNSGHEYENLGAEHALDALVPAPADTALWLHLGANAAARDWHDATGVLMPLPSADPQRYLVVSPALIEPARRAFAGQAGLESPYPSDALSAGELTNIIKAGYPHVGGVFGANRFHHVVTDDARCIHPPLVEQTGRAFIAFVEAALAMK